MFGLIPNWNRWKRWSMPTKMGYIAAVVATVCAPIFLWQNCNKKVTDSKSDNSFHAIEIDSPRFKPLLVDSSNLTDDNDTLDLNSVIDTVRKEEPIPTSPHILEELQNNEKNQNEKLSPISLIANSRSYVEGLPLESFTIIKVTIP